MRKTALFVAGSFTMLPLMLPSAGFAQQVPGMVGASSPPAVGAPPRDVAPHAGSPLYPDAETGLDKVAGDGVSTKTVKAAPCGAAAMETDGFTTCVGIPAERARKR